LIYSRKTQGASAIRRIIHAATATGALCEIEFYTVFSISFYLYASLTKN